MATSSRELSVLSMLDMLSPETCRMIAEDLAPKYAAAEKALADADARVRVAYRATLVPDAPHSARVAESQARKASESARLDCHNLRLLCFHANYRATSKS